MTGTIKAIKVSLWLSILIIVMGCANPPKDTENKEESTITRIPNIVKALEALGSVNKKKVDKEEEK